MSDEPDEPTERVRVIQQLWSDGDYAQVGAMFTPITDAVVAALDLVGRDILDAATGTGNTALAAARAGGRVRAFDLTPRLLATARERAADAGLSIEFAEGDLLDIPYPADAFDVVLSTFGAFLADDPKRCAAELVRVCRPGGLVVSTAWGSQGTFGALMQVVGDLVPAAIDPSRPDPWAWAEAGGLSAIFEGLDVDIDLDRRTVWFPFPSTEHAFALFEEVSGPFQRVRTGVEAAERGSWAAVRAEVLRRWDAQARQAGSGVELPGVYGVARIRVR